MIRVLVVDDAPVARGNIERAFGPGTDIETVGTAETAQSALAQTLALRPDVVVIDIELQGGEGLLAAQLITRHGTGAAIVATGLDDDETTRRAIGEAGVREYLVKPYGAGELVAAIRAAAIAPAPAQPPQLLPAAPAADDASQEVCTIAVIAAKGGVGCSIIATSLALIARSEAQRRSVIVDLDPQRGDVRRLLRVNSRRDLSDLLNGSLPLSPELVGDVLTEGPAGLAVLNSPVRPHFASEMSPDMAVDLVGCLRDAADTVVFDLPKHLSAASVAVMRSVDRIVVVSGMSDPAVRNTHGLLSTFGDLSIPREKILLVLNRNEANAELSMANVEELLGLPVSVQLPYDFVLVSTSVNRGVPFVLQRPDAQVTRKVRELAMLLFPFTAPQTVEAPPQEEVTAGAKLKSLFGFGRE